MPLTIHAAVRSAARRNPRAVAVRHDAGQLTYGELEASSRRLAAWFRSEGRLQEGETVALLFGNEASFFTAVLATSRAGLTAVPLPSGCTSAELDYYLADCGARVLVVGDAVGDRHADRLQASAAADIGMLSWSRADLTRTTVTAVLTRVAPARSDHDDPDLPFFVGYTSGTTGRPKGAVISQRARSLLSMTLGQEYGCYHANGESLIVTPLYHGAGMNRAFSPLMFGGSVLLHRRFDAERVLETLRPGGPSSVFLVPTMFSAMQEFGHAAPSDAELTIMSNASALPERLKHYAVQQWPNARIFEIYGSTEGGTISSLRPEDLLRKPRCVGQPLALTDVELREAEGAAVPPGEVGQLWSRSPYIFDGYLGRPEETAQVRVDGWVTCGDLARADDEGYLHIVGRTTDTIITGGVNVFPREVEEVIRDLDGVADAVVLGLPDDRWGERVHAVVVVEAGARVEAADVDRHCRGLLAGPKIPKGITVRSEVPRTATGKVLRAALVEQLKEQVEGSAP